MPLTTCQTDEQMPCPLNPLHSPHSPYKVTTIDARCEIAIRDVANFGLSKFISLLRRDIFYVCPYTSVISLPLSCPCLCPFPLSYFCCYYYYIIFENVHRSHLCNICVEAMIYGLPKHHDKCCCAPPFPCWKLSLEFIVQPIKYAFRKLINIPLKLK